MSDVKGILTTLHATLRQALDSAYYKQSIPSEVDKKLNEVLGTMASCNEQQRASITDGIAGDEARVLGLFAEKMATLAVRENSIEYVKQGLLALLIYARTVDARDVLLVLSLLHDATIKTGNAPKSIFQAAGVVLGGAEFLSEFLNRTDEDKSIDAMGYEESKNEEGFIYVRTW
jgi:hypothetical protein